MAFIIVVNGQSQTVNPKFIDGRIYFKINDNSSLGGAISNGTVDIKSVDFLQQIAEKYSIIKLTVPYYKAKDQKLQKTFLLEFSNYQMVDQLISELKTVSKIEYAEKAPIFKLFYNPNDTYYGTVGGAFFNANAKWHLDRIKADSAWDISKGIANVKVAVLDNAIWAQHPDLANKIVLKYDIADNDTNTTPPTMDLTWSHGTHTSGLVGAQSDNGIGVASIGYNVSLIAGKISRDSDGALIAGYEGIMWAADNGADIISMSWGSTQYMQTMQNIINYAYNKGCVMVAAAGNDGNDTLQYPASLDHVISVASTDGTDGKSSFSCYNPQVDVCAPGGNPGSGFSLFTVLSTTYSDASMIGAGLYGVSGKYDVMSGTSMSCPIVAGLCGLIKSVDTTLTPEKLENILKLGCDDIYPLNSGYIGQLGAGRVNAFRSVKIAQDSIKAITADFTASTTTILAESGINFTDLSYGTPTSWSWSFAGGTPSTSNDQNPNNIIYNSAGTYTVTLTISDGTNSNTETKTNYIIVKNPASSAWKTQSTHFTSQYRGIRNISIVNPAIAWASAYDGSGQGAVVLEFTRTKDTGNLWTPGVIGGLPSGLDMSKLFAINYDTAYAALYGNTTGGNAIFRTNDGGTTWVSQPTAEFLGTSAFPNIVHFFDVNNGICLGDPNGGSYEIYTTSDGGTLWTRVPAANIPSAASGEYGYNGDGDYEVIGNTIWYGTNKGNVIKSTDRGQHWAKFATGCAEVTNLTFSDTLHGLMEYKTVNTQGQITSFQMKSTSDGGETWNILVPTGSYFKSDIDAVPGKAGMYVSTGISQNLIECGSAFSLDYGSSWTQIDDSVQYTCVKFFDYNTGWAGGFNQDANTEGIWKWLGLIHDDVTLYPDFVADSITIIVGHSVNFTDLSLGNILNRQWDFAGGTPSISNDVNPLNIVYNTVGDYEVSLTVSNPDTSVMKTKVAYIHVVNGSSVSEKQGPTGLSIYPNPTKGVINIDFGILSNITDIKVYDLFGKLLFFENINSSFLKRKTIDLSSAVKGVYILEINGYNLKEKRKIIIY